MKEVDPHPPSLCMANELLALVRFFLHILVSGCSSRGSSPEPGYQPDAPIGGCNNQLVINGH